MKKITGLISIPLTLAISVGMVVVGGITVFWKTAGSTDEKINEVKTEISAELSSSNQRISVVETQVSSILKSNERLEDNFNKLFNSLIK